MSLFTVLSIALALAMDAFAASVASGIAIKRLRVRHALTIGAWFGSFQALMPLIGWLGGSRLRDVLEPVDHWIAFALLAAVGCKMVYEALKLDSVENRTDPTEFHVLFILSVATSLDALVAGFSFAILDLAILTPVLVIGGVTFATSFAGVWIGDRFGHFFEQKIEVCAGLLLIVIGVKILVGGLVH